MSEKGKNCEIFAAVFSAIMIFTAMLITYINMKQQAAKIKNKERKLGLKLPPTLPFRTSNVDNKFVLYSAYSMNPKDYHDKSKRTLKFDDKQVKVLMSSADVRKSWEMDEERKQRQIEIDKQKLLKPQPSPLLPVLDDDKKDDAEQSNSPVTSHSGDTYRTLDSDRSDFGDNQTVAEKAGE